MSFRCPGWGCDQPTDTWGACCEACWFHGGLIVEGLAVRWRLAYVRSVHPAYPKLHQRVTGSVPDTTPVNVAALDTLRFTVVTVLAWASMLAAIADELPPPAPGHGEWWVLLDRAVEVIRRNAFRLSGNATGSLFYNDLYRCWRALDRLVDAKDLAPQRISIPCPACGRVTVVSHPNGYRVACLTCSAAWGQAAWTFLEYRQDRQNHRQNEGLPASTTDPFPLVGRAPMKGTMINGSH